MGLRRLMEFSEKLVYLRKQKGLTQADVADKLFVSRTAVSKWESARGYPGIDSLKAIAQFYGVTLDELLGEEKGERGPEKESAEQEKGVLHPLFFIMDLFAGIGLILPLFGQRAEGFVRAVALFKHTASSALFSFLYFAAFLLPAVSGIVYFVKRKICAISLRKPFIVLSFSLSLAGTSLFILSRQPYAAMYLFVLLVIKVIIALKNR